MKHFFWGKSFSLIFKSLFFFLGSFVLGGCLSTSVKPIAEEPLVSGDRLGSEQIIPSSENVPEVASTLEVRRLSGLGMADRYAAPGASELNLTFEGPPVEAAFNDVPLRVFIHQVFGETLGLSYVLTPELLDAEDLVTLNLEDALERDEFFRLFRRILNQYGIDLRDAGGVWEFFVSEVFVGEGSPLLVSGSTLPDVPESHRTVFQIVPIDAVSINLLQSWLRDTMRSSQITIESHSDSSSIILKGNRASVQQALDYIEVLNQPFIRGKYSVLLRPEYGGVEAITDRVSRVLMAEGIDAGINNFRAATVLLPMPEINFLGVFSHSQRMADHVERLFKQLDIESVDSVGTTLFTYTVQNTQAEGMVDTLNQFASLGNQQGNSETTNSGEFVVDASRNLIIYRGQYDDWVQVLEILKELDKPVPSVLVEVLIAEITLTEDENFGVEFTENYTDGVDEIIYGTLGNLGLGTSGFSAVLNSAGAAKAALNAFQDNSRAVIRSRPNILVKSGGEATIEVGNEIPIIVSNAQGNFETDGNTNVLQEISYRNTGVILEVSPVAQANGLVDIEISQELSEASTSASTSFDGSPTILNRSLSTQLTLRDGGAIVIGGLLSNAQSEGTLGVPLISDIPILGSLFSKQSASNTRTELIVMIAPYVITTEQEAQSISRAIMNRLELHSDMGI